ncbi:hypothetical protein ACFW6S_31550 [Streptomyces sp. NPDC058740]|uniref:hypothetical protein n=1 Tax=Streptomyces sp. NPDC058740 TaxID=3346619 RepID=UPI0036B7A6D3
MDDEAEGMQAEIDIEVAIQAELDRHKQDIGDDDTAAERGQHPEITAELLFAAAGAAKEAQEVLNSPWAVYQARDAQTALAAALDLLMTAQGIVGDVLGDVEVARRRGDIPDTDGLANTMRTAREAAEHLHGAGRYEIGAVVEALATAERHFPGRLPRDYHETVHATAEALGDAAWVNTQHHDASLDATETSCGCALVVTVGEATWYVNWNDDWGAILETGRTDSHSLTEGVDFANLGMWPLNLHPQQLAEAIRRRIPSAYTA